MMQTGELMLKIIIENDTYFFAQINIFGTVQLSMCDKTRDT